MFLNHPLYSLQQWKIRDKTVFLIPRDKQSRPLFFSLYVLNDVIVGWEGKLRLGLRKK